MVEIKDKNGVYQINKDNINNVTYTFAENMAEISKNGYATKAMREQPMRETNRPMRHQSYGLWLYVLRVFMVNWCQIELNFDEKTQLDWAWGRLQNSD